MRVIPDPRSAAVSPRSIGLGRNAMRVGVGAFFVWAMTCPLVVSAAGFGAPLLRPKEPAIPTSLFGTYIRQGEWLVYPFYEYTRNKDAEYSPSELGFTDPQEYRGDATVNELLLFIGYGLSERVALEFEAALYTEASLKTAADDMSAAPDELTESGLGDVQSQVRWLWTDPASEGTQVFSFGEVVFPVQDNSKVLIGTTDWEFALGLGAFANIGPGTLEGRISAKYEEVEGTVEPGEYALEYLMPLSTKIGGVLSLEGEDDELSAIGELQWVLGRNATLKTNLGVGITDKAEDFAPEIGIIWSF